MFQEKVIHKKLVFVAYASSKCSEKPVKNSVLQEINCLQGDK